MTRARWAGGAWLAQPWTLALGSGWGCSVATVQGATAGDLEADSGADEGAAADWGADSSSDVEPDSRPDPGPDASLDIGSPEPSDARTTAPELPDVDRRATPAPQRDNPDPSPATPCLDRTLGDAGYQMLLDVAVGGDGWVTGGAWYEGPWNYDAWLVRFDAAGEVLWSRTYGALHNDVLEVAMATPDGGFAGAGSNAVDGPAVYWGSGSAFLVRANADGALLWHRRYFGGDRHAGFRGGRALADGGFALTGHASGGKASGTDSWFLRVDAAREPLAERFHDLGAHEVPCDVAAAPDGTFSPTSRRGEASVDDTDEIAVLQVDSAGDMLWQRDLGATRHGNSLMGDKSCALVVFDDGVALAADRVDPGRVDSFGGNLAVWRLDGAGETTWTATYGGPTDDRFGAAAAGPDGGLLLAGATPRLVSETWDLRLMRLDAAGEVLSDVAVGGREWDWPRGVAWSPALGIAVVGETHSVPDAQNQGWFVRLDAVGESICP